MKNLFHNEGGKTLAQTAQSSGQMDAPSLETFMVRLYRAWNNLIWLKMSLFFAGDLDWMTFKGLLQPKLFCDSTIL